MAAIRETLGKATRAFGQTEQALAELREPLRPDVEGAGEIEHDVATILEGAC